MFTLEFLFFSAACHDSLYEGTSSIPGVGRRARRGIFQSVHLGSGPLLDGIVRYPRVSLMIYMEEFYSEKEEDGGGCLVLGVEENTW